MYHLLKDVDAMELTNEVYNSVNRYFSTLAHTGYKSYSEVNKLLVFIFIEEMLCGPLSEFITEEDYKSISKAIYCLYGSCMIPFPDYKKSFDTVINRMLGQYRLTELNDLRNSESYKLRVKS